MYFEVNYFFLGIFNLGTCVHASLCHASTSYYLVASYRLNAFRYCSFSYSVWFLISLTYCATCFCSCGDGTLGVPNQRGDNYECRNMKLLLKQQQRVITSYYFFSFILPQFWLNLSVRFLLLVLLHSVEADLAHDYNNLNACSAWTLFPATINFSKFRLILTWWDLWAFGHVPLSLPALSMLLIWTWWSNLFFG